MKIKRVSHMKRDSYGSSGRGQARVGGSGKFQKQEANTAEGIHNVGTHGGQ